MKVNFDTNNSYNQSFGAFKISDGALKTFKKRYMKPTDIDSFEHVLLIREILLKVHLIQSTII